MVDLSATIAVLVVLATILFMWKCKTRKQLLEVVKQDGWALRYASAALKDDREIVLEAVKQNGDALYYASAALQDDREIVDCAGGPREDACRRLDLILIGGL